MPLAALLLLQTPTRVDTDMVRLHAAGFTASRNEKQNSWREQTGTFRHSGTGLEGTWLRSSQNESIWLTIQVHLMPLFSRDRLRAALLSQERNSPQWVSASLDGTVEVEAGNLESPPASGDPTWKDAVRIVSKIEGFAGSVRKKLTDAEKSPISLTADWPLAFKLNSLTVHEAYSIAKQYQWPELGTGTSTNLGNLRFPLGKPPLIYVEVHHGYYPSRAPADLFRGESRLIRLVFSINPQFRNAVRDYGGWTVDNPYGLRGYRATRELDLTPGRTVKELNEFVRNASREAKELWSMMSR